MDMEKLEQAYNEYVKECKFAARQTQALLENLQEQINDQEESYDPFESMKCRIKTFDSVVRKCNERHYELSIESIKERVKDVVGFRIITPFFDDVYEVADAISAQPGITVRNRKDYVAEPKPSGYQSLHLIVLVKIYTGTSKIIPVEIQIRTGAMNLWAKREHMLQYRNDHDSPEISKLFDEASKFLRDFDQKIMQLRNEMTVTEPTTEKKIDLKKKFAPPSIKKKS